MRYYSHEKDKEQERRLAEICGICSFTKGDHYAGAITYLADRCPNNDGRFDWVNGEATSFCPTGNFKKEK